jgi:hypothetical protein
MAKNGFPNTPLSFVEIVMRADAETIKAAYEARVKVDGLLAEREAAYRRIAELETQVDEIMGEPGVFIFPDPPCPVAGFSKAAPVAPKKPAAPKPQPKSLDAEEPKRADAASDGDN